MIILLSFLFIAIAIMQDISNFGEDRTDKYRQNWSENIQYTSTHILVPETVSEVQKIVKSKDYRYLKVIGTRHCFNTIADTRDTRLINGQPS